MKGSHFHNFCENMLTPLNELFSHTNYLRVGGLDSKKLACPYRCSVKTRIRARNISEQGGIPG